MDGRKLDDAEKDSWAEIQTSYTQEECNSSQPYSMVIV
jgi:hypothetical protein